MRGSCGVCLRHILLRRDEGIRVHGPVGNRCPGSGKPPNSLEPLPRTDVPSSTTAFSLPPPTAAAAGLDCGLSPPCVTCIQLQPTGKILKRIPRSSRELAATKLAAILEAVIVENDVTTWMRLLNFPGRCLRVPMRGGRRWSLARQVNHQLAEECDLPSPSSGRQFSTKKLAI